MKVVIDPNVLISAVVASGASAELLDRWLTDRSFDVVACPALIGELRAVLARDRFRRWISVRESGLFVARIEEEAERWADPTDVPAVTGDPKDDYLVALYRDCDADLLISGDSDLLALEVRTSACSRQARCSPGSDAGRLAGYRSHRRASQPREPTIAELEAPPGRYGDPVHACRMGDHIPESDRNGPKRLRNGPRITPGRGRCQRPGKWCTGRDWAAVCPSSSTLLAVMRLAS